MVVVHKTENTSSMLLQETSKMSKTDKAGFMAAMDQKDVIVMGKTIYEYAPALIRFKKVHGRKWKQILEDAWHNGCYPSGTFEIDKLQRYRNQGLVL